MFTNDASGINMARFSLEEQQLYGRARLGIMKINEELFSEEFTGTLGADIRDYASAVVGQQRTNTGRSWRAHHQFSLTH